MKRFEFCRIQGASACVQAGMAHSTSPTMPGLNIQRPPSVRSVASNSSIASGASGVSLSRRPRARARSKTLTGDSGQHEMSVTRSPVSDLPYLDQTLVQDLSPGPSSLETLLLPARPSPNRSPRSPLRSDTNEGNQPISPQGDERLVIERTSVDGLMLGLKLVRILASYHHTNTHFQ